MNVFDKELLRTYEHEGKYYNVDRRDQRGEKIFCLRINCSCCNQTQSAHGQIKKLIENKNTYLPCYRERMACETFKLKRIPKNVTLIGGGWCTVAKYLRDLGYKGNIEAVEPDKKVIELGWLFAHKNMASVNCIYAMTGDEYIKLKHPKRDLALIDAFADHHKEVYPEKIYRKKLGKHFKRAIANNKFGGSLAIW